MLETVGAKMRLVLIALFLTSTAWSAEDCNKKLLPIVKNGPSEIIPSGRDHDVMPEYKKAADIIFGKNGIAEQLGLALPPHTIEFVPSSELATLASLGRHAVPHWNDGSVIATQAQGAAGVLEFVTPGCPTCRSFYSDTTSPEHQISIMMHVAGHNDFSVHSKYARVRNADPTADSLRLAELLEKLYKEYDHDDVSNWYHHLLTLSGAQDMARGTFEHPDTFVQNPYRKSEKRIAHSQSELENNVYGNPIHPKHPSPSLLQAYVSNLPQGTPQWKKDVAVLFEKMFRVYGYYTSTKTMNEGWATFMQELIAIHSPWTSSHYSIEFADLLSGVAVPRINNPYWLGREAWRNIYRNFKNDLKNRDLKPMERDRKFVEYAHKLIQQMDDYDFLRFALDEAWVFKYKLYLSRKADWQEWDHSLPRPNDPKLTQQRLILSRDPKRVVDVIARNVGDRTLQIPRVMIKDFNGYGRGVVVLEHDVVNNVPLKRTTMLQSLYVHAQIMQKPVSMITVKSSTWEDGALVQPAFRFWPFPFPPQNPTIEIKPIRIEVNPRGEVQAWDQVNGKDYLPSPLTPKFQEYVDAFKDDWAMSVNPDLLDTAMKQVFGQQTQTAVANVGHHSVQSALSHAPTAARALLEYSSMVQRRMMLTLENMLNGKLKIKKRANFVRLRVLPLVPEFELDRKVMKALKSQMAPAPVEVTNVSGPQLNKIPATDENSDLGSGDGKEGDKYWGPGDEEGQGEGEGEDGEGEDGQTPGGEDGGKGEEQDPSEIDIPIELYGELLSHYIELPNLRPKSGFDELTEDVREGGIQRPFGNELWARIVPKALALGQMALKKKGIDPNTVDKRRILQEGFRLIQPADYVVSDRDVTVIPEINAVVAIWMDMTGSMWGLPTQMAREFLFNLKAILKARYKKVEFRYVGFSDAAKEFEEDKFFNSFFGGGTNYFTGINKTKEILDTYSPAKWDKFSVGFGDAEDGVDTTKAIEKYKELLATTQYSVFVQSKVYPSQMGNPAFVEPVKQIAADPANFFGYGELLPGKGAAIEMIKKLFGKRKN
jgi:uncharacterized sporulation protein YeaH/YhbH (DUF444 family)/spore cortex formation protein SpoVR/YcgB (stage V sporulation)